MDEKLGQEKKQMTVKRRSKLSVEANMERLEALLEELEANDTSLEETFSPYEKGMKLAGEINERLTFIEEQMEALEDRYADTSL